MRIALEAVAEFLSKYGALEEANNIMNVMAKMGWAVPANSKLQWRSLIAVMKQELNAPESPDYVFLFERLIQLILVERFAVAFEGHDAELFKLESDVLCHTEGIYDICLLVQDKLFRYFSMLFEAASCGGTDGRPLARFIENAGIGPTQIEIKFSSEDSEGPTKPRKRIRRDGAERRFPGSPTMWRELSLLHSIELEQVDSHVDFRSSGDTSDSSVSDIDKNRESTSMPASRSSSTRSSSSRNGGPPQAATTSSTTPSDQEDADLSDTNTDVSPKVRTKRKRWSQAEVEALRKGYKEFSSVPNVWMMIKSKYADVLARRSNVDIKDKYRNLLKYGKM